MGIQILVVCETALICSVVKHAILTDQRHDIEVIGCATKVSDAEAYVEQGHCNMVLVHARLRKDGSLALVKRLATKYPKLHTIVFDLPRSQQVILPYLEGGASGYILREDSVSEMLEKIKAVHENRPIICPTIAGALVNRVAELANSHSDTMINKQKLTELTPREREVLGLLGHELSNQEIANELVIEVGTVKNHVHHLLKKLGVHSRHDATAYLPVLKSLNGNPALI